MATLFPPIIENKLPAFVDDMKIPFLLGIGTTIDDFTKILIKINNTYTQKTIGTIEIEDELSTNLTYFDGKYQITVPSASLEGIQDELQVGLYYGVQLALANASTTEYCYSKVGTIKKIQAPELTIDISDNFQSYIGNCTLKNEERVHSYCFNLYNGDQIIETSGWLIHNNSINDIQNQTKDSWESGISFTKGLEYVIEYNIKTVNGYETNHSATINYKEAGLPELLSAELIVECNQEEGYNKILLSDNGLISSNQNKTLSGNFILIRASSKDEFTTWERIINFNLKQWKLYREKKYIYKDYYIESGIAYRYAIQACGISNPGEGVTPEFFYSSRVYTSKSEVENYFEDCFLTDGDKQLKIRFNPKVGTFKPVVLENKIDTIGGKYPYFSRNGNVLYKEFQIQGLISLNADINNEFKSGLVLGNSIISSTSLEGENFKKEREFKNLVLDWLSDGKPKVFKSSAEGTFIVRLMNVSLSPLDTVGRMLHSFSCTAYEIADFSFNNLRKFNFLEKSNLIVNEDQTVNITTATTKSFNGLHSLKVYGDPNTQFTCTFSNESISTFTIPYSGKYVFTNTALKLNPIKQISFSSIATNNKVYIIYKDTMSESFIDINLENITTSTNTASVNLQGRGITKIVNNKEVLDLTCNLLTKTESESGGKTTVVWQHGHYGRVTTKPIIDVYLDGDIYKNALNNSQISSWIEGNVYKILDEENYYIPSSTNTEIPSFSNSLSYIQKIFSIHNGDGLLVDWLSRNEYYIIKDFSSLYLGQGLQIDAYLSNITTVSKSQGGTDIYAL